VLKQLLFTDRPKTRVHPSPLLNPCAIPTQVEALFSPYGEVTSLRLVRASRVGPSTKTFAFVKYANVQVRGLRGGLQPSRVTNAADGKTAVGGAPWQWHRLGGLW